MGETATLQLGIARDLRRFSTPFDAEQLAPSEFGHIGEIQEQLLNEGFAQIAYLVVDRLTHGEVSFGTRQRLKNELGGKAVEALGEPFVTRFHYEVAGGSLVAENGESIVTLNKRGLRKAEQEAVKDTRLMFRTARFEADVKNAVLMEEMAIDETIPVGTTLLGYSACPDFSELGVPRELLSDLNYQPDVDQAMVWCATKTDSGIEFKTVNLFHADPQTLQEVARQIAGHDLPTISREETPHQQVLVSADTTNVAEEFRSRFDSLMTHKKGHATFHGLNKKQYKGLGSEYVLEHPEFITAEVATYELFDAAAQSLISGDLKVNPEYLQALLMMKKPNGEFELEGARRQNVIRGLNGKVTSEQMTGIVKTVYIAGSSALWATLSQLYYTSPRAIDSHASQAQHTPVDYAAQLLPTVEHVLASGKREGGCPGGGAIQDKERSIFDMTDQERMDVLTDKGDNWSWKKGICRVDECPTRPGQTEVGPCSVCRGCQREFDKGKDPSEVYSHQKKFGGSIVKKVVAQASALTEYVKNFAKREKITT